MYSQIEQLVEQAVPVQVACAMMAVPRSSYYQAQKPVSEKPGLTRERVKSSRALSDEECETIWALLDSERFMDHPPRQIYATLLDENVYHCSVSTMYRLLRQHDEVRERRNQRQHPTYNKPELMATKPNQLWSWDITKLRGPYKLCYYYLYVILDLYSRYVVGWMIAEKESAQLAQQLISESCHTQGIKPDQLTIHADRGGPMIAKTMAELMIDLGIAKSHSRPYVPNDNPFSESQFKTAKYRPDFPGQFGSVQDARLWGRSFFPWYNHEHHHTGLKLLTPADVHFGRDKVVIAQRQAVLNTAYAQHPERFVKGQPLHPALPEAVWINPPQSDAEESALLH